MLDAAGSSRLQELRRLAYGRSGGLTPEQAAELRDLEQQRRGAEPAAAEVVPPADAAQPGELGVFPDAENRPEGDMAAAEAAQPEPAATPTVAAPKSRRRWWGALATAAALAVIVGVGIGWAAAPSADARPVMPADQGETFAALERDAGLDPGSIEYIGSKADFSLWVGTKSDGTENCLALTVGHQQNVQCLPADQHDDLSVLNASLDTEIDGMQIMAWGSVLTDVRGREVGIIQTQEAAAGQTSWEWQFSEAELEDAKALVALGHAGSTLSVIGYDGDRAVWAAFDAESCVAVVIDGQVNEACGELTDEAAIELTVGDTIYSLQMTDSRGPQLTVIRHVPQATFCEVEPGATTECTSIDDKTGKTGG